MNWNGKGNHRLALVVVAMVVLLPLLQWVRAQGRKAPVHMSTDWSNRHMVFSRPTTMEQTWRVARDLRYGHQWLRQNPGILMPKVQDQGAGPDLIRGDNPGILQPFPTPFRPRMPGPVSDSTPAPSLRSDWGMSMQPNATTGTEMFPAKFSFDVSAAPNCALDYVVFNSGLASSAGAFATETGTFTANTATNGQTATITNGAESIVLVANTGALTTASGTVTVAAGGPHNNDTVTVGAITYRFRTVALAAVNDVLAGVSNTAAAQNLKAIIDDAIGECATATCFNVATTTAPNPAQPSPSTSSTPRPCASLMLQSAACHSEGKWRRHDRGRVSRQGEGRRHQARRPARIRHGHERPAAGGRNHRNDRT